MGLAYLCPVDMLFSLWFYHLVNIFKTGMLNRTGFTVGLEGQPSKAGEIMMLEMHGALVCLVLWSLWVAREHLTIVQSLLSSNFAVIPQFLVKGIFFNQIQVDV